MGVIVMVSSLLSAPAGMSMVSTPSDEVSVPPWAPTGARIVCDAGISRTLVPPSSVELRLLLHAALRANHTSVTPMKGKAERVMSLLDAQSKRYSDRNTIRRFGTA